MKVALDLTAVPKRLAGAGVYMVNLAKALAASDDRALVFFGTPGVLEALEIDAPHVAQVPVTLGSRGSRLLWEQATLPGLLTRHGVDVLHSPHYTAPLLSSVASVVTFHDMTFLLYPELHTRAKRVFFPWMMRRTSARAARLIADSEATRQDVIRLLGVPPEKIVTVYLAASDRYRPSSAADVDAVCSRYGIRPQQYFLYVGIFEPRKNIPALIRAFAEVARTNDDVSLALAGMPGWMHAEVFDLIHSLDVAPRIQLLGYVPESDLPPLYTGARAFVYPSLYEGFGLPVLEAMQCGTPVITSNVSSTREVGDGAALLVDPHDVGAIADAMKRVAASDAVRSDLVARGVARAATFSWRRCADETWRVYEAAVEAPIPRRVPA